MSLNDVRKSPSFASILVGSLVFLGTGCSSPQVARIQSQKSAKEWKAGFVESAAGEMKVQYAVEGEYGVIGGDVLMPLKKIRETSKAKEGGLGLFMGGSLWPNARIPYSVSPDFCCNAELQQAMTLWSAAGVTFAPKQDSDVDYVYIVNEPPNPTRCGG
ncbi:hypothetical protein EBR21_08830, partial [bacterium]|nr:hypothetical protein [bacterium]